MSVKKMNFFVFVTVLGLPLLLAFGEISMLSWFVVWWLFGSSVFLVSAYMVLLKCAYCDRRFSKGIMQPWSLLFIWRKNLQCPRCKNWCE